MIEGSNLYYAILFEKQCSYKNKVLILHAFHKELIDVIHECSDPGVARIKFKWWQEEIIRLKDSQPRHPVTKELLNKIEIKDDFIKFLISIIQACEQLYFLEQPNTLADGLNVYRKSAGEIWSQCGRLAEVNESTIECLGEAGALYHFLKSLQQVNLYLTVDRCIIPSEYITQAELLSLKMNNEEKQDKIFENLLNDIKTRLLDIELKIDIDEKKKVKHAIILIRLSRILCEEILNNQYRLLDSKVSLTPIRRLWIAWRTSFSLNYL